MSEPLEARHSASQTVVSRLDRRTFLKVLGAGGCAMALNSVGCTIAEVFDAGELSETFNLADAAYSALSNVNGTAVLELGGRSLILIRIDTATIVALNRICTHQGADMDPAKAGSWDGERLRCKLHDSYFSSTGEAIEGPATADLASYPVTFDATTGEGTVTVGGGGEPEPDPNPIPEEYRGITNPYPPDDASALEGGQTIWAQCGGCHGMNGEGNPAIQATAFNGDNSGYQDDYLFWRLRTGGETGPAGSIMPAYSEEQLSDDELWQVITYLRSLGQ